MPLHILTTDGSSFYGEKSIHFYLWNDLIVELGYGWNELDEKYLLKIRDRLKSIIDETFAGRTTAADRIKEVPYGKAVIRIDLSSLEEKQALFLIRTYNLVSQALDNKKEIDVLIVPDFYNHNHDRLFSALKTSDKAHLIADLASEFGPHTTAIIDDFFKLRILERRENMVQLNDRSKRILSLAGRGSAHS